MLRRLTGVVLLLMAAAPAQAAITKVQHVNEVGDLFSDSTETTSFTGATVGGNLLVVVVCTNHATRTITGITDDAGNTYAAAESRNAGGGLAAIWYKANANAGAVVVTVNLSGAGGGTDRITLYEFDGVGATPTEVSSSSATTSATTHAAGSITTPGTDAVIVAANAGGSTSTTMTIDSDFTQIGNNGISLTGYRIVTASESQDYTITTLAARTESNVAAAFEGTGAPATTKGAGGLTTIGVGQ